MTKYHSVKLTTAEANAGINAIYWCQHDESPNWVAAVGSCTASGFSRISAVRECIRQMRSQRREHADYGGVMDATGTIHSDADCGL